MKRILLPTDFSVADENAFRHAFNLFGLEQCEYVLMHAFGDPLISDETYDWLTCRKMVQQAEEALKKLEARLQPLLSSEHHYVRRLSLAASPVAAINHLVQLEHFDWVVLGAPGRGESIRMGSVATELIQANHCNMLVVPAYSEPGPLSEVVFATEYAPIQSLDTLQPLRDLVERHQARLTLLTITTDKQPASVKNEEQTLIQHYFEGVNQQIVTEHYNDVLTGIVEFVDAHPIDLLVTISHHRSIWDALFNRSLTRKLAYRPLVPLAVLADQTARKHKPMRLKADDIIF